MEKNPLEGVRVQLPTKHPLKTMFEQMTRDLDFSTPAERNFREAERRHPSKNTLPSSSMTF